MSEPEPSSTDLLDDTYPPSVDSLYHGPLDALFRYFWRYLPESILDLLIYLPRREYRRFRRYLSGIREVARDIVRKSIVKGDGRDIMSVLLRANNSEDPKTKLSFLQDTSFGRARYICKLADMVFLGTC